MTLSDLFSNPFLLEQALTHASASDTHYEKLEFLGDRVLDLVIAEWLLELYPEAREGFLTTKLHACVCRHALVTVARNLNLEAEIRHEFKGRIPPSILADACEALIGALYLDSGLTAVRDFVHKHWIGFVAQDPVIDNKQALQEWAQKHAQRLPDYQIIQQTGSQNRPWFKVEVSIGREKARGEGASIRLAEKVAAKNFLDTFLE